MAKNKYDIEMEEEMCEECGDEYTAKKPMKEGKGKSLSRAHRMQLQDETEEDEDEMVSEEEDMEDEDEMMSEEEDMEMEDEEEDEEEEEDEDEEEEEEPEAMEEALNRIFSGSELTEDFKVKAATLFEAAVNDRVRIIESKLASKFTSLLESEVEDIANTLTEQIDSYLNYVVSEWIEENKLAVERGIRTDVAESFISDLKQLFVEHNIHVPEGQTDLLDETANNLQRVTEQLNRQIQKTVELKEELKQYHRAEIFAETADGLSSEQTEKLRSLAENMEYSNNDEFATKLDILKENYIKGPRGTVSSKFLAEETDESATNNETTSDVSAYLKAITRKMV